MANETVIAFPGRDFQSWLSWVECELSILGFDLSKHSYDWKQSFDHGLRPEQAAAEAARSFASVQAAS
jgi:hypothetical protein